MRVRWQSTRPWDLAACALLVALALGAALGDWPAALRVPLGLAFVLAAPGYAFVAALYPERHREGDDAGVGKRGLSVLERVALSAGLSIAVVPLLGLVLNLTPWGIRLVPVAITVAAWTVACCAVAAVRRQRLPDDERMLLLLGVGAQEWRDRRPVDKVLSVALVASVVFAAGALVYVLATPRDAERFTEFYILGPTGKASCYPAQWTGALYLPAATERLDCPVSIGNVTLGAINHEGAPSTYWLRAVWTREARNGDNTTTVLELREVATWTVDLPHVPVDLDLGANFTPQHQETFTIPPPPWPGTQRLSWQLFREAPPPAQVRPGVLEEPYRRLHVWIEG